MGTEFICPVCGRVTQGDDDRARYAFVVDGEWTVPAIQVCSFACVQAVNTYRRPWQK